MKVHLSIILCILSVKVNCFWAAIGEALFGGVVDTLIGTSFDKAYCAIFPSECPVPIFHQEEMDAINSAHTDEMIEVITAHNAEMAAHSQTLQELKEVLARQNETLENLYFLTLTCNQILSVQEKTQSLVETLPDTLANIKTEIETVIMDENIKDPMTQISSISSNWYSIFEGIRNGLYPVPEERARNMSEIIESISDLIPGAAQRIHESAFNMLDLIRQRSLSAKEDLILYNLKLNYSISRISTAWQNSVILLDFARNTYPFLETSMNDTIRYLEELKGWIEEKLLSSFSTIVPYLLNYYEEKNHTDYVWEASILSQKVLTNIALGSRHLATTTDGLLIATSKTLTPISIKPSEEFSYSSPILQIAWGLPQNQQDFIVKNDPGLATIALDGGSTGWKLVACARESQETIYNTSNFACIYSEVHGKYLGWKQEPDQNEDQTTDSQAPFVPYAELIDDIDPSRLDMFWILEDSPPCARFYATENMTEEVLEVCHNMTNVPVIKFPELPSNFAEKVKSIWLAANMHLQIFNEINYAGETQTVTSGSNIMSFTISSFILEPECARFYEGENYTGKYFTLLTSQSDLALTPIKSVFVPPNKGIVLCSGSSYSNCTDILRIPTPVLDSGNKSYSSIVLESLDIVDSFQWTSPLLHRFCYPLSGCCFLIECEESSGECPQQQILC